MLRQGKRTFAFHSQAGKSVADRRCHQQPGGFWRNQKFKGVNLNDSLWVDSRHG